MFRTETSSFTLITKFLWHRMNNKSFNDFFFCQKVINLRFSLFAMRFQFNFVTTLGSLNIFVHLLKLFGIVRKFSNISAFWIKVLAVWCHAYCFNQISLNVFSCKKWKIIWRNKINLHQTAKISAILINDLEDYLQTDLLSSRSPVVRKSSPLIFCLCWNSINRSTQKIFLFLLFFFALQSRDDLKPNQTWFFNSLKTIHHQNSFCTTQTDKNHRLFSWMRFFAFVSFSILSKISSFFNFFKNFFLSESVSKKLQLKEICVKSSKTLLCILSMRRWEFQYFG